MARLAQALFAVVVTVAFASRGDEGSRLTGMLEVMNNDNIKRKTEVNVGSKSVIRSQAKAAPSTPTEEASLMKTLEETASAGFVGDASLPSLRANYSAYRTLFIMGMVLCAFARQIYVSVQELRCATGVLNKVSTEEMAAAARGDNDTEPIAPREFAARAVAQTAAEEAERVGRQSFLATLAARNAGAAAATADGQQQPETSINESPPQAQAAVISSAAPVAASAQRVGLAVQPQAGRRAHSTPASDRAPVRSQRSRSQEPRC